MNDDFMEAMLKIRVSSPQISSSFWSTDLKRKIGTEMMTWSAHLASSKTKPFPEDGSMMSTRWPNCLSRSANQRPILPYPPMIAMWCTLDAVRGSAA